MRSICCFFLLVLFAARTQAQEVAATATLLQNKIQVGDMAKVNLEVSQKKDAAAVAWTSLPDSFGKIEVLQAGPIDTLSQDGRMVYRQELQVTGFDSGRFVIPPFRFEIKPRSGAAYTLLTDSLPLLVHTVAVDTTKPFRPIKDVMKVPASWRDYIWYFVVAFAVLLLGFLLYYYLKKKKAAAALPPPPENISDKALRELRALDQKNLWEQGEEGVKAYYVQLTDIVRRYIEVRFGVKALEQTTDEFLAAVKHHRELKAWSRQLFLLLHTADMAKFARAQPDEIAHLEAMQAAQELVQQSRPVIVDASNHKKV